MQSSIRAFVPSLVKIGEGEVNKMMHGIPDKKSGLSAPLVCTTKSIQFQLEICSSSIRKRQEKGGRERMKTYTADRRFIRKEELHRSEESS